MFESMIIRGSEEKTTKVKVRTGNKGLDIEQNSLVKVKCRDIAHQLQSIDHFIFLYENEGKYYLPPRKLITWHYVRQILSGEKLFIKVDQIRSMYTLPKSRGLCVNDLFKDAMKDIELMKFFPDIPENSSVPRNYFLTVL